MPRPLRQLSRLNKLTIQRRVEVINRQRELIGLRNSKLIEERVLDSDQQAVQRLEQSATAVSSMRTELLARQRLTDINLLKATIESQIGISAIKEHSLRRIIKTDGRICRWQKQICAESRKLANARLALTRFEEQSRMNQRLIISVREHCEVSELEEQNS